MKLITPERVNKEHIDSCPGGRGLGYRCWFMVLAFLMVFRVFLMNETSQVF